MTVVNEQDENQSGNPYLVGVLGNLALAVVKLGFGLFGGSKLVLVDGLFSLMIAAAFLVVWQAAVLEKKKHDDRWPYGLGKILFLSMAAVGLLGLIIAVHMFFYSLKVMSWGQMYGSRTGAIMATIVSIAGNAVLYQYLVDKSRAGPKILITLAGRYNRIDIWISTFVLFLLIFVGLGATFLSKLGVAAISVVVFIVGLKLVLKGFGGIMDKVPDGNIMDRIKLCASSVGQVNDVTDIKARYVGTFLHIDMSIAVDDDINMGHADGIVRDVRKQLTENIPFANEVNVLIA